MPASRGQSISTPSTGPRRPNLRSPASPSELPTTCFVFVTGSDTSWLSALHFELKQVSSPRPRGGGGGARTAPLFAAAKRRRNVRSRNYAQMPHGTEVALPPFDETRSGALPRRIRPGLMNHVPRLPIITTESTIHEALHYSRARYFIAVRSRVWCTRWNAAARHERGRA